MRPQAAALKELLDRPELQVMPGCGDAMGARLIEEAGFRTGFISGSSIAAMRLAMPDMDLLTFPEMADAVETCIAAAPNVLWLADGDTGYPTPRSDLVPAVGTAGALDVACWNIENFPRTADTPRFTLGNLHPQSKRVQPDDRNHRGTRSHVFAH